MKALRWQIAAAALASALGLTGFILQRQLIRQQEASAPLPDYGSVPAFVLADQTGGVLGASQLRGTVWVAGFIFTRCAGQCPMIISRMKAVAGGINGVQMVVFSMDPKHDTPQTLLAYAKDNDLNKPNWHWLTELPPGTASHLDCQPQAGCIASPRQLSQEGFRLSAADGGPPEEPITHSTRLVLVDAQLRIRGYYDANDRQDMKRLKQHAAVLARRQ